MAYIAAATVVLTDYELQEVQAMGDTRNEALMNLGYAATGINVMGVIPSSISTRQARPGEYR